MSKQQINQTYITNPQASNKPDRQDRQLISSNVMEAYEKLHKNIDQVHIKVDHVISKHQSEFLLAYRSHIIKIQKQLGDIKNKSQEQEKMFSSNDRIKFLQKQIAVFREEALIVYQKLQKTAAELEIYKRKYEEAIKQFQMAQKSTKESIKNCKIMEATKAADDLKIMHLQQQLTILEKQIARLKHRKQCEDNYKTSLNYRSLKSDTNSRTRYDKLTNSIVESSARKSIKLGDSSLIEDKNYKDLFFECVRKLKKQIEFRKGSNKIDVSKINTLEDFRQLDKIKVLELFFSNPKLEALLYEKLFPNSLFEKIEIIKTAQQNKNLPMQMSTTTTGFMLPRVRQGERRAISKLDSKNISMF